MSAIENTSIPIVRPLIDGCGTILGETDQATLAIWLLKTSLAHTLTHRQPSQEHKRFYELRQPWEPHQITIGAYNGDKWASIVNFQPLIVTKHGAPTVDAPNAHLTTLLIGHLIAQVFFIPHETRLSFSNSRLRFIWPFQSEFVWPPGRPFRHDEIQGLATADFFETFGTRKTAPNWRDL